MPCCRHILSVSTAAVLALSACSSSTPAPSGDDRLKVIAAFYPVQFIAEHVAGDGAEIATLTAAGVDPHDVELSPRDVGSLSSADLVLYSSGLQPAVDEAVQSATPASLDVNDAARLVPTAGSTSVDPHFWLDPERMVAVTEAVAAEFIAIDPDETNGYRRRADALIKNLGTLGQEYDESLMNCSSDTMVTTHTAFGYLADAHGFTQIGITGISGDADPSPGRLAEVSRTVEQAGVPAIYSEVLLGADIAETVANETGAEVLVLDPIEGITEESAGSDYLEVMRANLNSLTAGQQCQ